MVVTFPRVLSLVDIRAMESLRIGRDDHAMIPGL
jgi:hypothetical protein